MTPNLTPFHFEATDIRAIELEGEAWFVATDVARALGYSKPHDAIDRHCKGSVKHRPLATAGGMQSAKFIGESDVLRLIVSSHLPAAQRFERWIFEDVLPSIRKTGRYAAPQFSVPQTFADALQLAADMARANTALVAQVAEQAPKVAALDRIADAAGAMCLTSAAKHLQIKPREFTEILRARGWIYRRGGVWVGHAYPTDRGYLIHKLVIYARDTDGDHASEQVLVTAKGIARLARLLESPKDATAHRALAQCAEALHG